MVVCYILFLGVDFLNKRRQFRKPVYFPRLFWGLLSSIGVGGFQNSLHAAFYRRFNIPVDMVPYEQYISQCLSNPLDFIDATLPHRQAAVRGNI